MLSGKAIGLVFSTHLVPIHLMCASRVDIQGSAETTGVNYVLSKSASDITRGIHLEHLRAIQQHMIRINTQNVHISQDRCSYTHSTCPCPHRFRNCMKQCDTSTQARRLLGKCDKTSSMDDVHEVRCDLRRELTHIVYWRF